jgi:hypothetical protein
MMDRLMKPLGSETASFDILKRRIRPQLVEFLKQDTAAHAAFADTMVQMRDLARRAG